MIKYSTDWLGLPITYYNVKNLKISPNINDVIDYSDLEFHPEGLKNYLEFGYSVFGQTPVKHVKYLLPKQSLEITGKSLKVHDLSDNIIQNLSGNPTQENSVLDLIMSKVRDWESKVKGDIVIPTSGGFDSRVLNLMISDKNRIKSFTYGVSDNQYHSFEVVYAQKLSQILKTNWRQIELGHFHNYLDRWNELYGISTHAHGMYQMEFYENITKLLHNGKNLLSGIIGDAWSGNVRINEIKSTTDIVSLGYTHGITADSSSLLLSSDNELRNDYFKQKRKILRDERVRIIESMRMKILLLSYLIEVPRQFGFETYSPFLDIDIVSAMLRLPPQRRRNRIWQRDYFMKNNVNLEDQRLDADMSNTLDLQGMIKVPLPQLNTSLLGQLIRKSYIESVNEVIKNASVTLSIKGFVNSCIRSAGAGFIMNKLGSNLYNLNCPEAKAYSAYMILKPLEYLLARAEK